MKKTVLTILAAALCSLLAAQEADSARTLGKTPFRERIAYGVEYTTELQTDFKAANWVNQLHLSLSVPIGNVFEIEAGTYSVGKTREESLIDDLQGFSNIEEENMPLALSVLGMRFNWKSGWLSLGVRNVNEEYFTSPATSLFTGSSCGIFPTIAANCDIANYPLASLGMHLQQSFGDWTINASVYNGQGYKRLVGAESQFRFVPKSDGVFAMAQVDYQRSSSGYFLGVAGHSLGELILYSYIEQAAGSHVRLLVGGGYAPIHRKTEDPACRYFVGCGLVADVGSTQGGIYLNHASYTSTHESAIELTWQVPILKVAYLQPAVHIITLEREWSCIAMLRLGIAL